MKKSFFDRRHLMDYTLYGILSGIFFSITAWFYLYDPEFRQEWILYMGSGFFMFIILLYMIKLIREPKHTNSTDIIIAGHFAVIAGIFFSIGICLFLSSAYEPEVFSMSSNSVQNPPADLFSIFLPDILVNFLAGSFICFLIGYAAKWLPEGKENSVSV